LVVFSKDELKEIQTVRNPSKLFFKYKDSFDNKYTHVTVLGILVLGFKQKISLKVHHKISHPYFIYPDESVSLDPRYYEKNNTGMANH
jgi:hypothetical protein